MFKIFSVVAAPSAQVNSVPLAAEHQATLDAVVHSASFWDLLIQADIIVKLVMLILVLASIFSWAIIFEKTYAFMKLKHLMNKFEQNFWSGKSLDILFKQTVSTRENHPFAHILIAAMQEWGMNNITISDSNRNSVKERMLQAIQVANNRSVENMEENISFLAIVASAAPFIGLFGTVWGIMSSFQSIAATKNTTLAVVAPGIAEALLATAIGLVVAIPASIFYNKFSADINKLANKVDNFAIELNNIIARDLDKK